MGRGLKHRPQPQKDTDMVLDSGWVLMSPLSQMVVHATEIATAPAAVWSSDTKFLSSYP